MAYAPIMEQNEINELERELLDNHQEHIAYLVDAFRFACLDLRAAVRNGDARQAHEASQNVICTKRRLDDLETYPTHTRRPQRAVKARE